jgi:hypothetical protein
VLPSEPIQESLPYPGMARSPDPDALIADQKKMKNPVVLERSIG